MKTLEHATLVPRMILNAKTAKDLMTPNPASISHRATVGNAAIFLARRGISAAPVIDEAGRPVGVVSRTDLLSDSRTRAFTVYDVMTPGVFCVAPDTAAEGVVEKMLALEVRRLFVVDTDGVLVGVVSAVDVLRKLRRWGHTETGTLAARTHRRTYEPQTAS